MAVSYLVTLPIKTTPIVSNRVVNVKVNDSTTKIELFSVDTKCIVVAELGDKVEIEAFDEDNKGNVYKLGDVISFTASNEIGEITIGQGVQVIAPPEVVPPVVNAEAVVVPVEPEPEPTVPAASAPDETQS